MARVDVVMPQMGESITEGTVVKWHKKVGDAVQKDETLLEISTDKVDSEIPSPASGILADIAVQENETVAVQTVIAHLETDAAGGVEDVPQRAVAAEPGVAPSGGAVQERAPDSAQSPGGAQAPAGPAREAEDVKGEPVKAGREPGQAVAAGSGPAPADGTPGAEKREHKPDRFYSPLVLSIARNEGVSMEQLEQINGSGEGGRVTKKDISAWVDARRASSALPRLEGRTAPAGPELSVPIGLRPVDDAALLAKYPPPGHEVLQMSNVLQRMARHMVQSVQTSPHVAAIHEVDMTSVVTHRSRHAEAFEKREGFRLTYTPYVVDAVVRAIKKFPLLNSSVEGDRIIRKRFINLGIAVAADNGLIVPVIKRADEKNFLGYARAVNDLAVRTRAKKLTPDDIQGGTFTISNYGVFGTMMGTPIINQPQVAILGTGAVTRRVAVIDEAIAIRSLAYFTLSFDHRIIDGAMGGKFLAEIVQILESFDPESAL